MNGAVCGLDVADADRTSVNGDQELALRASLDRTYVSAVEKGRQNIMIGAALRIADALNASLSDLIGQD